MAERRTLRIAGHVAGGEQRRDRLHPRSIRPYRDYQKG
jgi:hypothetical protein